MVAEGAVAHLVHAGTDKYFALVGQSNILLALAYQQRSGCTITSLNRMALDTLLREIYALTMKSEPVPSGKLTALTSLWYHATVHHA